MPMSAPTHKTRTKYSGWSFTNSTTSSVSAKETTRITVLRKLKSSGSMKMPAYRSCLPIASSFLDFSLAEFFLFGTIFRMNAESFLMLLPNRRETRET